MNMTTDSNEDFRTAGMRRRHWVAGAALALTVGALATTASSGAAVASVGSLDEPTHGTAEVEQPADGSHAAAVVDEGLPTLVDRSPAALRLAEIAGPIFAEYGMEKAYEWSFHDGTASVFVELASAENGLTVALYNRPNPAHEGLVGTRSTMIAGSVVARLLDDGRQLALVNERGGPGGEGQADLEADHSRFDALYAAITGS